MIHSDPHPLAGQTVTLRCRTHGNGAADNLTPRIDGQEYQVEDWWDRVTGGSWMTADGNPAALQYAIRSGLNGILPTDNDVVYGKVGGLGFIVHASELVAPEVVQ